MIWEPQPPAVGQWQQQSTREEAWPKFDPAAEQSYWDVGVSQVPALTVWDDNVTLWDIAVLYPIWAKQ